MIKTDVKISSCGYEADLCSTLGGNCYRLYHRPTDSSLLRTPRDEKELFSEIFLFGNPILFPCNRIRGGEFTFEDRIYRFPINEPETGCHIHGALYKAPFTIEDIGDDRVTFVFRAKAGEYLGFDHGFVIKRHYLLDADGLHERVEVTNLSEKNMPFMLAFHTTLNIPFANGGSADACRLSLDVTEEQLRDENYLPTLRYRGGTARERAMCKGRYEISSSPLSALYGVSGQRAVIRDSEAGLSIAYEGDAEYRYRMLWRREGAPFFVIEPQTCAIDCFHLERNADEKGLIVIPPHETISLCTRLALEK